MPVEGRGLSSRQTQDVVRDLEIGQPINSAKCSETADGVTRESEGRSRLPLLRPVRQDSPRRHPGPCLRAVPLEQGRAGRGWTGLRGGRGVWCSSSHRLDSTAQFLDLVFTGVQYEGDRKVVDSFFLHRANNLPTQGHSISLQGSEELWTFVAIGQCSRKALIFALNIDRRMWACAAIVIMTKKTTDEPKECVDHLPAATVRCSHTLVEELDLSEQSFPMAHGRIEFSDMTRQEFA